MLYSNLRICYCARACHQVHHSFLVQWDGRTALMNRVRCFTFEISACFCLWVSQTPWRRAHLLASRSTGPDPNQIAPILRGRSCLRARHPAQPGTKNAPLILL